MAPLSRPNAASRSPRAGVVRVRRVQVRPALAAGTSALTMIALCAGTARSESAVAARSGSEPIVATLDAPVPLRLGDERASRDAGRTDLTVEAEGLAAAARQTVEDQRQRDRAAAKVAAAASARITVLDARPTGGGPAQNRELGRFLTAEFGWDAGQFSCVDEIFSQESGWSVTADNPSSSAYGIPQALPGSKMASAGPDWQTNPETQIRWGLGYIDERYGTPCAAWNFKQGTGWY